jgi:hypothetical protein
MDFLAGGCDLTLECVFTKILSLTAERASVAAPLNLYMGHKPEAMERRSKFCGTLQELSAEGGGEVRCASESARQSDIKDGLIGVAEHHFGGMHS